jgi:hypothetical protein
VECGHGKSEAHLDLPIVGANCEYSEISGFLINSSMLCSSDQTFLRCQYIFFLAPPEGRFVL